MLTNFTGDDRPILDKTGLTGKYDLTVRWVSSVDTAPLPTEMSVAERRAERERRRRLGDPGRPGFCRPTETPDGFHVVTSLKVLIQMAFGARTNDQLQSAPE